MAGHRSDASYILEFRQVGTSVKVSAIDPASGTEVSISGPATAAREHLAQLAVRKLEYVLLKGKDN